MIYNSLRNAACAAFILVNLLACSSGLGSGDEPQKITKPDVTEGPETPVVSENFALIDMPDEIVIQDQEIKTFMISLEEHESSESEIAYFSWSRVDGAAVAPGVIRPQSGLVHFSQHNDQVSVELNAEGEISGEYRITIVSEDNKTISRTIGIRKQ